MAERHLGGRHPTCYKLTMLLDRADASKVAEAWCVYTQSRQLDPTGAVETETAWYFPWIADGIIGSNGVIVGKSDGAVFVLGSAFSVERDIHFFDRGFGSKSYDLVILEVFDMSAAVALVEAIRPSVVEPSYESGAVWRVGRDLSSGRSVTDFQSLQPCSPTSDSISSLNYSMRLRDHASSPTGCSLDAGHPADTLPPYGLKALGIGPARGVKMGM